MVHQMYWTCHCGSNMDVYYVPVGKLVYLLGVNNNI